MTQPTPQLPYPEVKKENIDTVLLNLSQVIKETLDNKIKELSKYIETKELKGAIKSYTKVFDDLKGKYGAEFEKEYSLDNIFKQIGSYTDTILSLGTSIQQFYIASLAHRYISMQSAMQNIRDVNVRRQLQSQMALMERILARAVAEELKMSIKDLDELTPEERRRITDRITQLASWYKGLIDTVKGSIANRFVLKYGDNPEFVSSITSLVEAYFDVPSTVLMELTNAVGEKIADYRVVGDIMGYIFMKDSDLMNGLYKKSRE
ncbi:MAG: hypothetical protein ACP5G1_04530, partial [Nanopusillaceae archaeon]